MDFDAINETLDEDEKTKDLFVWLDANKPRKQRSYSISPSRR